MNKPKREDYNIEDILDLSVGQELDLIVAEWVNNHLNKGYLLEYDGAKDGDFENNFKETDRPNRFSKEGYAAWDLLRYIPNYTIEKSNKEIKIMLDVKSDQTYELFTKIDSYEDVTEIIAKAAALCWFFGIKPSEFE